MATIWEVPIAEVGASDEIVWAGILGYEDRCTSSIEHLIEDRASFAQIHVGQYSNDLFPARASREAIRHSFDRLMSAISTSRYPVPRPKPVFLKHDGLTEFRRFLRRARSDATARQATLIIDVSSMTSIHALAIAPFLSEARPVPTYLVYTAPRLHSVSALDLAPKTAWVATITGPLSEVAWSSQFEEPRGAASPHMPTEVDGFVLLGPDESRLDWGLRQVPVSAATFVLVRNELEPSVTERTQIENGKVLEEVSRTPAWSSARVDERDVEGICRLAESAAEDAVVAGRRMMIFPFGPKHHCVAIGLGTLSIAPSNVWYCYPVSNLLSRIMSSALENRGWYRCGTVADRAASS